MAAFEPFEPAVISGATGKTVVASIGAGAGTSTAYQVVSSLATNPSMLVTLVNNAGQPVVAYFRMSVESSTTITATAADTPIAAAANGATVLLFANPSPIGTTNIAVIVTVTPSTAGLLCFTPGQGGGGP